ncbi:unnamed protein product [Amoebophrya sp. A25]|nr:unnamed protein product [Amoebophrya sp. A25]|eukprot:GSA25T00015215001.1
MELPSSIFELLLHFKPTRNSSTSAKLKSQLLHELLAAQPESVVARLAGGIRSGSDVDNQGLLYPRVQNMQTCKQAYLENLAWGQEPILFLEKGQENAVSTADGTKQLQQQDHDLDHEATAITKSWNKNKFARPLLQFEEGNGKRSSNSIVRTMPMPSVSIRNSVCTILARLAEAVLRGPFSLKRKSSKSARGTRTENPGALQTLLSGHEGGQGSTTITRSSSRSSKELEFAAVRSASEKDQTRGQNEDPTSNSISGVAFQDSRNLSEFFLRHYAFTLGMEVQRSDLQSFHPLAVPELRQILASNRPSSEYPAISYVFARTRARQWFTQTMLKGAGPTLTVLPTSSAPTAPISKCLKGRNATSKKLRASSNDFANALKSDILERNFHRYSFFHELPSERELHDYFFDIP